MSVSFTLNVNFFWKFPSKFGHKNKNFKKKAERKRVILKQRGDHFFLFKIDSSQYLKLRFPIKGYEIFF